MICMTFMCLATGCAGLGVVVPLPQLSNPSKGDDIAVMETSLGVIKLRFFPKYAPKAVENFITHAKNGYYDNVIFHRVIKDFVIQGGDPEGTGMGGESIWGGTFELEATPSLHHIRGALAMARSAQSTSSNGSQFYIVQNGKLDDGTKSEMEKAMKTQSQVIGKDEKGKPTTLGMLYPKDILQKYINEGGQPGLDFDYTVFGQVIEGMDVVDKIAAVEVDKSDKPKEDVVIKSIKFEKYAGK